MTDRLVSDHLPIVLVPGLNCSARLYAEQIPALWRFGPVMVADHRRDDSIAAIARRILAAAPPRFALAGLSMGGYIAFEIMRQAPERVAKLALLDTGARPETAGADASGGGVDRAGQGRPLRRNAVDMHFPVYVHRDRHGDAALKRLVRAMAEETGPEAFLRQQQAIIGRPDSRPGLAAIACPTLVLVGRRRRADAAGAGAGDRRRHPRRAPRRYCEVRTPLDAGAAAGGDAGAGRMDGVVGGANGLPIALRDPLALAPTRAWFCTAAREE